MEWPKTDVAQAKRPKELVKCLMVEEVRSEQSTEGRTPETS